MGKVKIKRTPVKKTIKRTPIGGPLILSKKDPSDDIHDFNKTMKHSSRRALKELQKRNFLKDISSEVGYIEKLTETNLEPTNLYDYQKKWIADRSKYRHGDKSRQIGQSYSFACEGYAKSQLLRIYTSIFVSYNQEEANEKIVYARMLHESVPFKYKKTLVVDRITALEFEGKLRDGRRTRTRLISHPQREPRGKGFNTDVFLDEIAHYQWPEKVYVAAVPIVTRGYGQLSLASSPLGKSGLHYDIGSDIEKYSMFSRHKVYWWENPDFLNEDAIRNIDFVKEQAFDMKTIDRVLEFGNDAIIQAYHSMIEEDFQQEYELEALDDSVSYYPRDLINQCTFETLSGRQVLDEEDIYGDNPIHLNPIYPDVNFKIYGSIEELSHAIFKGKVGRSFFAGYDVGRDENNSEVIVIEELPSHDHLQIVRLLITMKRTEFRKQHNILKKLFKLVPIKLLKIDSGGMGQQMGENLRKAFHSRIDDLKFNNENKKDMATNFKLRLEDQSIAYPNDKDLIRQIHSVKRKVTENSVVKFEIARNRLHHGDKFWALALASSAGKPAEMHSIKLVTASATKVHGSHRIITTVPDKLFKGSPAVIHGTNWKKLPAPPRHANEFARIPEHINLSL